jgi:hypothetical protein
MTSVGIEPQQNITQPVVFTTRPRALVKNLSQFIYINLFL